MPSAASTRERPQRSQASRAAELMYCGCFSLPVCRAAAIRRVLFLVRRRVSRSSLPVVLCLLIRCFPFPAACTFGDLFALLIRPYGMGREGTSSEIPIWRYLILVNGAQSD